jgi:uncharacterized protein YcbK (DUF882 family)
MKIQLLSSQDVAENDAISTSRRQFIKNIGYGALLTLSVPKLADAAIKHSAFHKSLAFQNINTGDKLRLTYFEQGKYVKDALQEISYLFRDIHTGDMHPIDTALLDQLYDLKNLIGARKPFHIVSGYRSPYTNAKLRKRNHAVAKHSLHMQGRAIDIRIEGVETKIIRNAALAMRSGGVGYYPNADFVHLDTGEFRTW